MLSNRIKMTMEQASALRVIIKFEFVGRTGELLKTELEGRMNSAATILSYIVRNAEIWSRMDSAIAYAMLHKYREKDSFDLADEITVEFPHGFSEIIQTIVEEGIYKATLKTANSSKHMQTSMGSMIPVAIVERNIDAIKEIFAAEEESPLVFFPMKASQVKN